MFDITHSSSDFSGLTLPVWVAAAAKAATELLMGKAFEQEQLILVPDRDQRLPVLVTSASLLADGQQAIGISHCHSGLALDITNGLEIWACVRWQKQQLNAHKTGKDDSDQWLSLVGGNGVGKYDVNGELCLSEFAKQILKSNLRPLVPNGYLLELEIIFPKGRELASRTSNKAFGVIDGLALIGTQAEGQISASPKQLQNIIKELKARCVDQDFDGSLVLVIGENGLDLAMRLGIPSKMILKVGNWIGPLLVAAAEEGVKDLLLIGYHGKLIKLAGNIFHTHHHLADGRIEILTSIAVREGLPLEIIVALNQSKSVESAFLDLQSKDRILAEKLWQRLATTIEQRSSSYVGRYRTCSMRIGAAMFDRQRRLLWAGPFGIDQLAFWRCTLDVE